MRERDYSAAEIQALKESKSYADMELWEHRAIGRYEHNGSDADMELQKHIPSPERRCRMCRWFCSDFSGPACWRSAFSGFCWPDDIEKELGGWPPFCRQFTCRITPADIRIRVDLPRQVLEMEERIYKSRHPQFDDVPPEDRIALQRAHPSLYRILQMAERMGADTSPAWDVWARRNGPIDD